MVQQKRLGLIGRFNFFIFLSSVPPKKRGGGESMVELKLWVENIKGEFKKEIVPGQSISAWSGIYKSAHYKLKDKPFQFEIEAIEQRPGAPYIRHRIIIQVVMHKFNKRYDCDTAKAVRLINPKLPVEIKFGETFPIIRYSNKGCGIIIPEYKYFSDEDMKKEEYSIMILMYGDSDEDIQEDLKIIKSIFGGEVSQV